jgi:Amt family ammonium transporter
LAVGIFGPASLLVQLAGIVAVFIGAFVGGLPMFLAIKYTIGLRVTENEELRGAGFRALTRGRWKP